MVLTGDADRREEAQVAAELFLPGVDVELHCSRSPGRSAARPLGRRQGELESGLAKDDSFDLVLVPSHGDAHQDHRLVAELAPTVWRDHLVLGYELPK